MWFPAFLIIFGFCDIEIMTNFKAQISKYEIYTPAEVRSIIKIQIQKRLIVLTMTEDYLNQLDKLIICFSSLFAVCSVMQWDISPYLRQALHQSRILWSAELSNNNTSEDLKKSMENSIDELFAQLN
jgi:hypothetical protein